MPLLLITFYTPRLRPVNKAGQAIIINGRISSVMTTQRVNLFTPSIASESRTARLFGDSAGNANASPLGFACFSKATIRRDVREGIRSKGSHVYDAI